MIHNGQAATHHEDVFWRSWDSPPPARRPPSLCPRAMLAPTTFTRCRPPSIPQIVSQKDRNGKALKINYETLVRRPTRLMVDRRHWRNVLRAEEVSFCTKPKPVASSCFVPQKDGRHRSKRVLFSGDPNIPRAVRYVDLLERAIRCNP